ncbi:hypothetical protein BBJ29_005497 [Phytophthora kernoviae]|uniref:RING-type domain-containing protein n=1 Tax=Phytophthora kernoviae TaxID=325452 RepID=A0A3F2RT26_9STRA|nr:hypothetical protein BBJ29_005497 [Phytophthora kernoviae]RLN62674.1 hypothetical protein BBP00_00004615 [Phytophthora kernoviae]
MSITEQIARQTRKSTVLDPKNALLIMAIPDYDDYKIMQPYSCRSLTNKSKFMGNRDFITRHNPQEVNEFKKQYSREVGNLNRHRSIVSPPTTDVSAVGLLSSISWSVGLLSPLPKCGSGNNNLPTMDNVLWRKTFTSSFEASIAEASYQRESARLAPGLAAIITVALSFQHPGQITGSLRVEAEGLGGCDVDIQGRCKKLVKKSHIKLDCSDPRKADKRAFRPSLRDFITDPGTVNCWYAIGVPPGFIPLFLMYDKGTAEFTIRFQLKGGLPERLAGDRMECGYDGIRLIYTHEPDLGFAINGTNLNNDVDNVAPLTRICWTDFTTLKVMIMKCSHYICAPCLRLLPRSVCPYCREPIRCAFEITEQAKQEALRLMLESTSLERSVTIATAAELDLETDPAEVEENGDDNSDESEPNPPMDDQVEAPVDQVDEPEADS